jgi:hypothetical protein
MMLSGIRASPLRPPARAPWFGEGKSRVAQGLSGFGSGGVSVMVGS